MSGEKHWGLSGGGGLINDLDLWEHACCWVFLTCWHVPDTSLASSTLQTLQKAEGWSFRTYGVSGCYLTEKLGAGPKVMGEESPQKEL